MKQMEAKLLRLFLNIVVEIVAVVLAWMWFDWQLALIIFLVFYARNLRGYSGG